MSPFAFPAGGEGGAPAGTKVDAGSLVFFEGRPSGGESDGEIVAGAWDFPAINGRYGRCLTVLGERPSGKIRTRGEAGALRAWAARERESWCQAVERDPLLPRALQPRGYAGPKAWAKRRKVLAQAARQARNFGGWSARG